MTFIRTCQECGYQQRDIEPRTGTVLTFAYTERKCKRCKSASLDHGSNKPDHPCPECGEELDIDEVDIGVGVQTHIRGCSQCGWEPK